MTKYIALAVFLTGCTATVAPGTPSECPEDPADGAIIVGSDEMWREDAEAFCASLGGSLTSLKDLSEILVAYREMSSPDVRGWVRETSGGAKTRYTIGWNGFVTPTIDSLDRAVAVCTVPPTR